MKRLLRKILLGLSVLLLVSVALLVLMALTPQGRTTFHTALFVLQTLETPVKPQPWFTDEPVREMGLYRSPDGTDVADVYRLVDGRPRAAVLLSLGAMPTGLDDPYVTGLGYALARAGYVAMFHWSPEMGIDANIDPSEPDRLVRAFQFLEEQGYVDRDRVGLGGFCVGASFALVAASDLRIRDRVHFVNAFGPFFDAEKLLIQVASRTTEYEGEYEPWEPYHFTVRVLANELIDTLEGTPDKEVMQRHYLEDQQTGPADLSGLSPQAMTIARLLDGVEPQEAQRLYATLPEDFRKTMSDMSPSTHIGELRARLLLMHDRYDELVPVAESRRLLDATRSQNDVRYTEFVAFEHTVPGEGGILTRLGQAFRLYRHMYEVIRLAS